SGPTPPQNYQQNASYMKGRAHLVLHGVDESSHLTVFSVGRATAINPSLFRDDVNYDGRAHLGSLSIYAASGRLGGLRVANVVFTGDSGLVGVHANDVQVTGDIFIGDIK